jgi:hypothetical protein
MARLPIFEYNKMARQAKKKGKGLKGGANLLLRYPMQIPLPLLSSSPIPVSSL